MARSYEALWLAASASLTAAAVGLLGTNVALDVVRTHYPFWTTAIMISAYVVGALALICWVGALREWALPFAGDRSSSTYASSARTAAPATPAPQEQLQQPPPALFSSAADLDGLSDEQIRLLRASATALENLTSGLEDLDRTPRLSADFSGACARMQYSLNKARDQLLALRRQVSVKAWPHTEWAIKFGVVHEQIQRNLDIGETQENHAKLRRSVAELRRLLKDQYPSLFTHDL